MGPHYAGLAPNSGRSELEGGLSEKCPFVEKLRRPSLTATIESQPHVQRSIDSIGLSHAKRHCAKLTASSRWRVFQQNLPIAAL
jgi:hypothetical protein